MKDTNPNTKLEKGHLLKVKREFKDYTPPSPYEGIVMLLADIIDTALSGRDCYCSFGLSKSKDLIMLTITHGGSKLYASGVTLEELASNAKLLL